MPRLRSTENTRFPEGSKTRTSLRAQMSVHLSIVRTTNRTILVCVILNHGYKVVLCKLQPEREARRCFDAHSVDQGVSASTLQTLSLHRRRPGITLQAGAKLNDICSTSHLYTLVVVAQRVIRGYSQLVGTRDENERKQNLTILKVHRRCTKSNMRAFSASWHAERKRTQTGFDITKMTRRASSCKSSCSKE